MQVWLCCAVLCHFNDFLEVCECYVAFVGSSTGSEGSFIHYFTFTMGPFLKCFEEKGIWLHYERISLWSIDPFCSHDRVGATVLLEGLPLVKLAIGRVWECLLERLCVPA